MNILILIKTSLHPNQWDVCDMTHVKTLMHKMVLNINISI